MSNDDGEAMTTTTHEPRAMTPDEIRACLLRTLASIADYWGMLPNKTVRERVDGAISSMLVIIDGESGALPRFELRPHPHPDDEAYYRAAGEDYYPCGVDITDGELHSRWAQWRSLEDR